MQVTDPRLRDGLQPTLLRLLPEVARNQSFYDFAANVLREALADDRCRHLAATEARQTHMLLEALDHRPSLAGHDLGWDLDLDLARASVFAVGGGQREGLPAKPILRGCEGAVKRRLDRLNGI